MSYSPSFHDNQPIWWIRRVPIYLTTILVALLILGMILTTFLTAAGFNMWPLQFSVGGFWQRGWFWSPLSCIFLEKPSFFFLIGMFFLYGPSAEVEKYLGRARFLKLLAIFVVVPPLVLTGIWKTLGAGALAEYQGSFHLVVGMFIAFATLYPNMEWFGWFPLKYVAFTGLALVALGCIPDKRWSDLALHLAMAGASFGYVRFLQLGGTVEIKPLWDRINPFRRRPKFRVVRHPGESVRDTDAQEEDSDMDALLDKISKSGMASLTKKERARLEQAREDLIRKDKH